MNIVELLQQDNIKTVYVAATNGTENHGECPWCGGNDRFLSWPNDRPEKGGRYYCRQCKKSGDGITYLIEKRGMKYKEACLELNIEPNFKYESKPKPEEKFNQSWEPRTVNQVPPAWSDKAEAVLFQCFKTLMSASGKSTREYLSARGINTDTIKQARIGLNLSDLTFDRQAWGLPLPEKKNALNHQIWIPAGIIIPMFHLGRVVRLRIRQANPKKSDRYILVAGSATAYLQHTQEFNQAIPAIVVESELDGWLIHQSAGQLVNTFSIGNSSARPDIETHQKLRQTSVLIALDHDQAGKKESEWWRKNYPSSVIWPSLAGKDPGEDFKAGTDIESWVMAGINALKIQKPAAAVVEAVPIAPIQKIETEQLPEEDQTEDQPQESDIFKPTTTCLHNKDCSHLSRQKTELSQFEKPVCLIRENKQVEEVTGILTSIFSMDACPKKLWGKFADGFIANIHIT